MKLLKVKTQPAPERSRFDVFISYSRDDDVWVCSTPGYISSAQGHFTSPDPLMTSTKPVDPLKPPPA